LDAATTDHVNRVRLLLTLMAPTMIDNAVHIVTTQGKDESAPTIGRLALIGTATAPRVAVITKLTPTKVTVSYLTESAIRHGRSLNAYNSWPVQFDSWPDTYREQAVTRWHSNPDVQTTSDVNSYAARHHEWALKTQAVYRAVKHCPWVAFAPIRNALIRREDLVMIPENGES